MLFTVHHVVSQCVLIVFLHLSQLQGKDWQRHKQMLIVYLSAMLAMLFFIHSHVSLERVLVASDVAKLARLLQVAGFVSIVIIVFVNPAYQNLKPFLRILARSSSVTHATN